MKWSQPADKPGPFIRRISITIAFVFGVGYMAGRSHVVGVLRDSVIHPAPGPGDTERSAKDLPPAPVSFSPTAVFEELDSLLFMRLDSLTNEHALWRNLSESSTDHQIETVKQTIRSELRELFPPWGDFQPTSEVEPQQWYSDDEIRVSVVPIESPPGAHIWTVLVRPRAQRVPTPAVLFLHGMGGTIESVVSDIDYHHGMAAALARRGLLVAAPFIVSSSYETGPSLYRKALAGGWTMQNLHLWQLRKVVDYLVGLPEIDKTHLGVYGISAGGELAMRLAALDDRLTMAIVSGFIADRVRSWFEGRLYPADVVSALPGIPAAYLDMNFVTLIHPRYFAIESGDLDERHEQARVVFQDARRLYEMTDHLHRTAFLEFDGGHETSLQTVLPFIERWLDEPAIR